MKINPLKITIILLILGLIASFFAFGGHHYLTFNSLKQNKDALSLWTEQNYMLACASFFFIYVITTALSLPGAAILTLAAGLVFGLGMGTFLSSFASSIGAAIAFLTARYFFKETLQNNFGQRLEKINEGIKKEGAFYLFTIRSLPIFPFFIVNILMGLTPMPLWTYYWVSQLAMLPGTAVYVNAGTQLGKISNPSEIFSPLTLFSFALLGIFPIIAKKTINYFKNKKLTKK